MILDNMKMLDFIDLSKTVKNVNVTKKIFDDDRCFIKKSEYKKELYKIVINADNNIRNKYYFSISPYLTEFDYMYNGFFTGAMNNTLVNTSYVSCLSFSHVFCTKDNTIPHVHTIEVHICNLDYTSSQRSHMDSSFVLDNPNHPYLKNSSFKEVGGGSGNMYNSSCLYNYEFVVQSRGQIFDLVYQLAYHYMGTMAIEEKSKIGFQKLNDYESGLYHTNEFVCDFPIAVQNNREETIPVLETIGDNQIVFYKHNLENYYDECESIFLNLYPVKAINDFFKNMSSD